jgi:prepilin-type N-terminal cleavage/methylation domain-containing protein
MKKLIKIKRNRGMSYVELIVVLSIFAVMSSIVIFNYGDFQAKVDIKNLASDIALKIVEAQKSSLSGVLSTLTPTVLPWKPSYGVYFNLTSDNKSFIYFADLNNNNFFDGSDCMGECLNKTTITKNNSISDLDVFYQGDPTPYSLNDLTIDFSRPNSSAFISSTTTLNPNISYVQITIVSPRPPTAVIKLYPSGRVQVN